MGTARDRLSFQALSEMPFKITFYIRFDEYTADQPPQSVLVDVIAPPVCDKFLLCFRNFLKKYALQRKIMGRKIYLKFNFTRDEMNVQSPNPNKGHR